MQKLPRKFIESAERCNYDIDLMQKSGTPHFYVELNKIISSQGIPGLEISAKSTQKGIKIKLIVRKGAKIEKPIFFCFGILGIKGKQVILPEIILEERAEAKIFAHCTFPEARNVLHKMEAKIRLKKKSKLLYIESHYHGEKFGTEVLPDFRILVGPGATFENEFTLNQGTIGKLKINLEAKLEKDAFSSIISKVIGKGKKDDVNIYDKISLLGENSRSLVKLRGAVLKGGKMFFEGETSAGPLAKDSQGHVDCQEIVVGKDSVARSVPIIKAENPEARITHEASVGKINQKELETLMTRGLSEKEAIDFIIRGALK